MAAKGRRGGVRSKLVEPYVQVRLGLVFVIINLVFAVLMFGIFTWYIYDIFNSIQTYFQLSGEQTALTGQKLAIPLAMVGGLLLTFVALTLYLAVHYTHKIYGPLVSIHRFLDELLSGRDPGTLALRESDQLKDLANKLNQVKARFK